MWTLLLAFTSGESAKPWSPWTSILMVACGSGNEKEIRSQFQVVSHLGTTQQKRMAQAQKETARKHTYLSVRIEGKDAKLENL